MKRFFLFAVLVAVFSSPLCAQKDTLWISSLYTTHVVFPTDISYCDLSNPVFAKGQIVEQNRNMVALIARMPFEGTCSVSALETNGVMHTFIIKYREHPASLVIDLRPVPSSDAVMVPPAGRGGGRSGRGSDGSSSVWKCGNAQTLQDILAGPQYLYHIGCKEYDVSSLCEDICSFNDVTYMVVSLNNGSGIGYEIDDATFIIENKHNKRRRVVDQGREIHFQNRLGRLSAAPGAYSRVAYSFEKLTLAKNQVLRIYLYENGGQRNLVMTVGAKDINRARSFR